MGPLGDLNHLCFPVEHAVPVPRWRDSGRTCSGALCERVDGVELDLSARQCAQSAPQKIRLYDWNRQERVRSLVEGWSHARPRELWFPYRATCNTLDEGMRKQKYRAGSTRKAKCGCRCASLSRETIQTTITGGGWDPRSEECQASPISNSALGKSQWFPPVGNPIRRGHTLWPAMGP